MEAKNEPDNLEPLKLFAAIFLDGELGGGPLEGLSFSSVMTNIVDFLEEIKNSKQEQEKYHLPLKTLEDMQNHLTQIATIRSIQKTNDTSTSAKHIYQLLEEKGMVFFPGGWISRPDGHAMIYQLIKEPNGEISFLAFNTGAGLQYHKKIAESDLSSIESESYKEKYNPLYAIRFNNQEQIKKYGGLETWIKKLIEPLVLPDKDPNYADNNASSIYEKIFAASVYLGGEVIDPSLYYPHSTAGQRSSTCAQQVTQKMMQSYFKNNSDYDRLFLDYRIFVLQKFLNEHTIPQNFKKEFHAALANTARMITTGKELEQFLNINDKTIYLERLSAIKAKADDYFGAELEEKPVEKVEIQDATMEVKPLSWVPNTTPIVVKSVLITTETPTLLFDKNDSLVNALKKLKEESEKTDKRLFIHNIEQLFFIYIDKIKDFKEQPFSKENTEEEWANAIILLHKYSVEYFDFYFKNKNKSLFSQSNEEKSDEVKPSNGSPSPRNQLMALGFMSLIHHSTIMHNVVTLGYTNWQKELDDLNNYLAYMPSWLLFYKMQSDFCLSSTDPKLSHLFSNLTAYFKDQKNTINPNNIKYKTGEQLLNHYQTLFNSPAYKEKKEELEKLFNEHIELFRANDRDLDSEKHQIITRNNLVALYTAFKLKKNPQLKEDLKSKNIDIKDFLSIASTHYHTDNCIFFCTKSIIYGQNANHLPYYGEPSLITGKHYDNGVPFLMTGMNGDRSEYNLYKITTETQDKLSTWRFAIENCVQELNITAAGKGEQRTIQTQVLNPLLNDALDPHLDSNKIRLQIDSNARQKELMDLRTAQPLQAIQVIDYFTGHMDLLEDRDHQFYMLFSLFQPTILDLALSHKADILRAVQQLLHRGISLGDLAQSAPFLTNRGLFLLKISSWLYGYVASCNSASADLKDRARQEYIKLDQDIHYWLDHDKRPSIQRELQDLVFYNLMKLYSPSELSLQENKSQLCSVLYARFYRQLHADDRVSGTITQTEEESFESMFCILQDLEPEAVADALPSVLELLLPDQAPFLFKKEGEQKSTYSCLDKFNNLIRISLRDGAISQEKQEFLIIPTTLVRNNKPFEQIIGRDIYPLAKKISETEYQFYWQDEEYYLAPQGFFKKISGEWYQCLTDSFLPEYLRKPDNYAWVKDKGDHALIYQSNSSAKDSLLYHWQDNNLYSHAPKGQVCFSGESRKKILSCLTSFEDSNLIEIILEDPPELQRYKFYLPRYQLHGLYDEKTGVTLIHENQEYSLTSHPSPFGTGLMISQSKTAEPWDCTLLVPIQPYYTKKTIAGSRYQLIHDTHRATQKDQKFNQESYAVLNFDGMGKLKTDSTNQLYLIYLYCAAYEYDKAFALLKNYSFQGTPIELTYLHWLCEKLPALMEDQKNTVNPISNSKLINIQLITLAKFTHVQKNWAEDNLSEEVFKFLEELPNYIINKYRAYHNLSNNLNNEQRISYKEIENLANTVWLSAEAKKRKAQKELTSLTQIAEDALSVVNFRFGSNPVDKPNPEELAIIKKTQEQVLIIHACERQQKEGSLAFINAKAKAFAGEKERNKPFVMPSTTEYGPILIVPYWPKTYQPVDPTYKIQVKCDPMEPGIFYLECKYDNSITYSYIDSSGKIQSQIIFNIKNQVLEKGKPFLLDATLKQLIIKDAVEHGHIPSLVGTLADLQKISENPLRNTQYERACEDLSLDMSNDLLFANLKYYFDLILNDSDLSEQLEEKLKDFCLRTVMACADLNERLKNPEDKGACYDSRFDRLQIAIILLGALENKSLFREAYANTIKQFSWNPKQLEKNSIWKIIPGFSSIFSEPMPAISHIASINSTTNVIIHKEKLPEGYKVQGPALRRRNSEIKVEKPFKLSNLSNTLAAVATKLQAENQNFLSKRNEAIKQFKKLPISEQHRLFDTRDLSLDELQALYSRELKLIIEEGIDPLKSIEDLKGVIAEITEDIVHDHMVLKHFAHTLPEDIQTLLSLKIKELGAKQLPIDIDILLKKYALGMQGSYLELRQVPTNARPQVEAAVKQLLNRVFSYRQYNRILANLQNLKKKNSHFKQGELRLQLAKLILELDPLKGSAALDLFQYQTTKTVRADQWALIENLMEKLDSPTQSRVGQQIMGGGKSKVILPILAFTKADGYHLSVIETPSSLLQTTYQDLRQTAKSVFGQELELFSFDRNSPCDPVTLMGYLAKFRDIIYQKNALIMEPASLQSLHLKWRELLYQAQFDPENTELQEQIDLLSEILELFKERADVVIDEIHKVLDINHELNYSIGKREQLASLIIKTTLNLYDFLETVSIQVDEKHLLSKLNGISYLDILNNPELLNHPPQLATELIAYYRDLYKSTYVGNYEQAKIDALLDAQWSIFLPLTLKQKLGEQYGASPDKDNWIAVPYAANNVPTKNFFANFLESCNYTTQMCRLEGVSFEVFKQVLKSWKKSDQEYLISNSEDLSEAEMRYQGCIKSMIKQENLPSCLKHIDVGNEEQLKTLYPYFQKNKQFIGYALEDAILPTIQLYPEKLTSNAINHANQVKRIQGLSGTPENHPTYDSHISFDLTTSFGTKNYLKTLLKNKNTPLLIQGEENIAKLSAIIDVGAHRRGLSNLQVAESLAQNLIGSSKRYVLFFHEDQLCAWKVGGTEQDVIILPSTEPDKIKEHLQVEPRHCFSYYDQSHTTGVDLPQAPKACAAVSVDVSTTLSSFLQAVARMRKLSGEQSIKIFLSPALKDKLGPNPSLDDLYNCLERVEKDKLADDVFKAACKKLYNVLQMDLDQRLRKLSAIQSIPLFKKFQDLLVDRNPSDIIELYGNAFKEEKTSLILQKICDSMLRQWQQATSSAEINPKLSADCNAIIQEALAYCKETQKTTLELGTSVSIKQQQKVQVELKIQTKTEIIDSSLRPNPINTSWAESCSFNENGSLTGDERSRSTLAALWSANPENVKKYPNLQWSNHLNISEQYYRTHKKQGLGVLAQDCALKTMLSTLFWQQGNEIHALLICQEEAEVLAARLTKGDNFNLASGSVWLETSTGLTLAGRRPKVEKNSQYLSLKEQIYTLDGETPLIAAKKELSWFSFHHLPLLQDQMLQQGKTDYATTFKELQKRLDKQLGLSNMQASLLSGEIKEAKEELSASNQFTKSVEANSLPQTKNNFFAQNPVEEKPISGHPAQDDKEPIVKTKGP